MPVTLEDVAEKAGTSVGTVSRILNNKAYGIRISKATQQKVLKIAGELNYRPNLIARSLRTQRSHTVGVIVPEMGGPYVGGIISGIEVAANSRGYFPLISSLENNISIEKTYLEIFEQNQVSGVIIVGTDFEVEEQTLEPLIRGNIPVVFVGKRIRTPYVAIDNVKGGFLATEYLIRLGHKDIGLIIGPSRIEDYKERWQGYRLALKQYKLEYNEAVVEKKKEVCSNPQSGYECMKRLLQRKIPSALFAYDDRCAFGAIRAIQERGLKVPEDVAVVGFDDISPAAYYNPPLTTIQQPVQEMGRRGAGLLIDLMQDKKSEEADRQIILECKLVIRKSSG